MDHFIIHSISYRRVLNSHVQFSNEFIVRFRDGSAGSAGSPQGETISIYEDHKAGINPSIIIKSIEDDHILGKEITQEEFDRYLQQNFTHFGRNNSFALSEAFFKAACQTCSPWGLFDLPAAKLTAPRLCLNILNGGWHAYTNPVLSDFPEFMLVAKSTNLEEVISEHNEIQRLVKEKQLRQTKTMVSDNPVNSFSVHDNRVPMEFLLGILDELDLSSKFDLMIDASAGDLWDGKVYRLGITDGKTRTSEEMIRFWMDIIREYPLLFLEDPFHELDFESWKYLTAGQHQTSILGDNLYSSDEQRILQGAENSMTHGVIIKPNQSGTVSAVRHSLEAALSTGQIAVASHRSISTDSTFLSTLACLMGAQYIKIGPLMTDYSSVIRLNEIIRLTE